MSIYEVVMVNNIGAFSQFIESETKPTIKEMNIFFDKFMIQNNLNRVSDIIPITQDQFDRWNSKKQYTLHKYVNVQKKTSNSNNKNIIQAKCIQKFRDKQNKIYGYRLIDLNGQTQDVTSDNLKSAIANNQICVINLTLSSDGRLVDTNKKQLQSKELGKAPEVNLKEINKEDDRYSDVAKAMVYLDKELIGMGDSYEEIVESRIFEADGKVSNVYDLAEHNEDTEETLDKLLYKAYMKLLNNNTSEIEHLINNWEENCNYDRFESNIQYENVNSINKSNIFNALTLVYKYARDKKLKKSTIRPLYDFLNRLKTTGVASINMGYTIGNSYYTYLNREMFGTISNSAYTVGHSITASDIKEHKEYKGYSYIFHKDINKCGAPAISIAALFKNSNNGKVQVDIKIERHGRKNSDGSCVGIAGYILDVESFIFDADAEKEKCAKIIAMKFNELAPKLYDLADVHQSLYSSLGYGKTPERVSLADLNSHGRFTGKELVDLVISRWTKKMGSRTPAKIDMIHYQSDESFRILYSDNVSDKGNDRRLYIKYNGKEITLKVLEGNDINKVIIEESMETTGSILDNSPALSEVLTKALISATVHKI